MIPRRTVRYFLLFFYGIGCVLYAQDLENAWQSYSSVNTRISELQTTQDTYIREQELLKQNINDLQSTSSWYNAWINKYLISNHSQRQLVILDSLETIKPQLYQLEQQQDQALREIKIVYEEVLKNYSSEDALPVDQRATSQRVGRLLLSRKTQNIQLPNYGDLVYGEYENPELRALVLADVRHLLTTKIIQLDSLLELRSAEAELATRLSDFHEDLGLQMEAEGDVQERDPRGEPNKLGGWLSADAATEFSDGALDGGTDQRFPETSESVSLNIRREGLQGLTSGTGSIKDMDYLKQKQLEYESLLSIVVKELDHSN